MTISVTRKFRQRIFTLLIVVMSFAPSLHAEDLSIRHEIGSAFSWSSYEYTDDDYVINGAETPLVSAHYERDYQQYSQAYSFFFTPILNEPEIPILLQQFYARPTTLRLNLSLRPEHEASHIFQNMESSYRSATAYTPRSRSAGLQLDLQPWASTGLSLILNSAKTEDQLTLTNTLGLRGEGSTDEIRRRYGLGVSHYFAENIRVSASVIALDREGNSKETRWDEGSPLQTTEVDATTEEDGQELSLQGTYIFEKRFRTQFGYQYHVSDSHSDTITSRYDNYPLGTLFYDDDIHEHALTASITWFWRHATSLQFGGSFSRYELERDYESDQNVRYAWDIWSVNGVVSHYIHRRFGLWLSYEFSMRDGDVETWHPQAEGDPRTVFQTRSDLHTLQAGVKISM